MDEKFTTLLSVVIVPEVIELMMQNKKLDEVSAITQFYESKTYEALAKEETKVWHFSPLTIFSMWKHEKETGILLFPEE